MRIGYSSSPRGLQCCCNPTVTGGRLWAKARPAESQTPLPYSIPSKIAWQTYSCKSEFGSSVNVRVNEYGLVNAFGSSMV